jgi:hypothetical protein
MVGEWAVMVIGQELCAKEAVQLSRDRCTSTTQLYTWS